MGEIKMFCVSILLKDTQAFIKQVRIMKIETITKDNIKDINYDDVIIVFLLNLEQQEKQAELIL